MGCDYFADENGKFIAVIEEAFGKITVDFTLEPRAPIYLGPLGLAELFEYYDVDVLNGDSR